MGKGKGKDQKGNSVAICHTCGKPGHLARTVGGTIFDRLQVIQPIHLQEEHQ